MSSFISQCEICPVCTPYKPVKSESASSFILNKVIKMLNRTYENQQTVGQQRGHNMKKPKKKPTVSYHKATIKPEPSPQNGQ